MCRRLMFTTIAIFSVALQPCAAAVDTAPPPGIVPTGITLREVLAHHRTAIGTPAVGKPDTRRETWTYTRGDLAGTQTTVSSGDDFREDTTLGPFKTARGSYHGRRWEENENGLIVDLTGLHERDSVDGAALHESLITPHGVTLLGEAASPSASYVVRVEPAGGRLEYVFYDKTTFLITRIERLIDGQRVVETYDDFRAVAGVTEAWHLHTSDGRRYNDEDWEMQSLVVGTPSDDAALHPPDPRGSAMFSSTQGTLPAHIVDDRVIVTTQINGRAVILQLDSGAAGILLDRSVADALKLPIYGKQTQTTAGTYVANDAVIPTMTIGPVTLHDVAVQTAPFHGWAGTPISGLLGFDFIDQCVVHVDYANDRVEVFAPGSFTAPSGAISLAIRLDDRVPALAAKIASTRADAFILDTGADRSMLFSNFTLEHPGAITDQGLGEEITAAFPDRK